MPTVRAITRATAADGHKVQSIVLGIVTSTPFQMRMRTAPAAEVVATR
jgi:Protein of unknown function (DUF1585)